MAANKVVRVSVRNLVEFVLQSGDLVSAFTGSSRMLDGGKIHRAIQQAQGTEYQPEVSLSISVQMPRVILNISGRADGVIVTKNETGYDQVTIDEIKSTTGELELIEEGDNPLYWAQAKCYAYMYAVQHDLSAIHVQISYCQAATLEIKTFRQTWSVDRLALFFNHLTTQYALWAERVGEWTEGRDMSARQLEFPFPSFRHSQRQLAVAVYNAVRMGTKLYAQAPTGTGKTIATVFPAVKAMGMGYVEKIFFLTAKTVTRQLAEGSFDKLRQAGLRFKTVTLTAKEKVCFMPEKVCNPEECPYAKGYYDKIGLVLDNCWQLEAFTREEIEQQARDYMVCPFELSLDLSLWADAIICDYNYVFDPRVYLKRFFNESEGHYCLLVDEAHNLIDRAREMFSAEITMHTFLDLKRDVKEKLPRLAKAAGKINSYLVKTGSLCLEKSAVGEAECCVSEEAPTDVFPLLRKFVALAEEWLVGNEPAEFRELLLDTYFTTYAFLRTAEMYDERYVTYVEKEKKDVKLKLFCVNPSYLLQHALARTRTAVFFSATLMPLHYFFDMLGGKEGDGKIAVESPFDQDHLCLLVADNISTTYRNREKTYDIVINSITAAIETRTGNYLVFLPSYQYMEEVCRRFCLKNPLVRVIRQFSRMSEEERTDFLHQFSVDNSGTLVGFAVLGGIFGEGIDLTGERLVGAFVVGVGLPQVCLEREIIRNWFEKDRHQGFEYAYMYPGMNKVLQAAGRVIRTENDKGMVLLIDDRFSQPRYRRLFPLEWHGAASVKSAGSIADMAKAFWMKGENKK
jgi:DNA excision repair protein ERCC-2